MPLVAAYHRPTSIGEALALLAEPNRVPLAGGTTINADRAASDVEVVDLQSLGLDSIGFDGGRVRIGATATLDAVSTASAVPPALQRIARAEAPSTLRTLATVGGAIAAADSDSVLVAALLVHDANVEFAGGAEHPLRLVLRQGVSPGAVITSVSIDPRGDLADAATGRTPADVPIVAAVGRRVDRTVVVALTGVAATPVLVDPSAPATGLEPPGDFRGTAEYRRQLAQVLTARVIEALR